MCPKKIPPGVKTKLSKKKAYCVNKIEILTKNPNKWVIFEQIIHEILKRDYSFQKLKKCVKLENH